MYVYPIITYKKLATWPICVCITCYGAAWPKPIVIDRGFLFSKLCEVRQLVPHPDSADVRAWNAGVLNERRNAKRRNRRESGGAGGFDSVWKERGG